jgi:hypothetical protein
MGWRGSDRRGVHLKGEYISIFQRLQNEEIENAIDLLLRDKNLRRFLEKNAKEYFDTYAAPDKVMDNIIRRLFKEPEGILH